MTHDGGSNARPVEGRPLDDADLLERARGGDADAYAELVARHQDLAMRVAWLITRDAAEAEDAVHDAFVKAWFALPRFRQGSPPRPWLLRIVANEAKNRVRAARRREALTVRITAASEDPARSPEAATVAREDAEALAAALGTLREPDRLVIAYRWLFDLSEAETAAALGVPVGTVKSRTSRAMARLRAALARQEVTG